MPAAAQLPLPRLRDPRYAHPLCAIETAKGLLDLTEDEIVALVEEGQLVAFDIKSPEAEGHELRILTASIVQFKASDPDDPQPSTLNAQQAVSLVMRAVRHDKPFVSRKEISRLLNCGRQHVLNLIERKALPLLPGTSYRPGPKGSPVIDRQTFATWLTKRLEGSVC